MAAKKAGKRTKKLVAQKTTRRTSVQVVQDALGKLYAERAELEHDMEQLAWDLEEEEECAAAGVFMEEIDPTLPSTKDLMASVRADYEQLHVQIKTLEHREALLWQRASESFVPLRVQRLHKRHNELRRAISKYERELQNHPTDVDLRARIPRLKRELARVAASERAHLARYRQTT